jgi:hypothetical protein
LKCSFTSSTTHCRSMSKSEGVTFFILIIRKHLVCKG